jgi:hypothetical protein
VGRYLVETSAIDEATTHRAMHVAARRYPEMIIEASFRTLNDPTAHGVWICHAPSDRHVRQWATAARLNVHRLTSIMHLQSSSTRLADDPLTESVHRASAGPRDRSANGSHPPDP